MSSVAVLWADHRTQHLQCRTRDSRPLAAAPLLETLAVADLHFIDNSGAGARLPTPVSGRR